MTLERLSPDVRGSTYPRGFQPDQEFHWPLVRAERLVTLNYGKALVDKDRSLGTVPVYGTNGRCGWHDTALRNDPTVILGRKGMGNLGVEWCEGPFWVIDTAYFVTPNPGVEIDLKFFYYLAKYVGLNHLKDGTSNPSLSRDTFYSQLLPCPPLPEQQTIARVLGALDDKIDLNRRMNETLEAMARALFQSWFIDFDSVTAKAEGRPPQAMSASTAALFPAEFEDSVLGPIPRGWCIRGIGDVVRAVGGATPSTAEPAYWDGGTIPWATPKDLSDLRQHVLVRTERCITETGLARISSGLLPRGSVLLSSRAPIGYLAIAETPVAINQGFIGMVCDGILPNLYALHWTATNMDAILGRANGTTFQEISKTNFRPIPVLVPPPAVLEQFISLVGPLHKRVVSNVRESEKLAALRDALLPRLLSGEIRLAAASGNGVMEMQSRYAPELAGRAS